MLNEERKLVKQGTREFSCDQFDGIDAIDFAKFLLHQIADMQEKHPTATTVRYDYTFDDTYALVAWGLETDAQYNARMQEKKVKEDQERQRDLATLKKLQAKYPDVKIEL